MPRAARTPRSTTWISSPNKPAPTPTAPAAPDNAQARAGDGRVTVTWNFGTESDLAGYNVYAGSSATGTPLNGGTLLQNAYYIDRDLTNGTERTYMVEAVDESGNKAAADPVSATPQADATDDRPTINSLSPADGATDVALSTGVSATLSLVAEGVDDETFTAETVKLTEVGTGNAVPASRSTSGGNDTITLIPDGKLKANTEYEFEITDGVKDLNGIPFHALQRHLHHRHHRRLQPARRYRGRHRKTRPSTG